MFKIIKWYAFICTTMFIFSTEIAQAMFDLTGFDDDEPLQIHESNPINRITDLANTIPYNYPINFNDETTIASAVTTVEKLASGWDFTPFNWAELFVYFSPYMSAAEFIGATQAGYASIDKLAELLTKKPCSHIRTIDNAKFFIFSAFSTLYNDRICSRTTKLPGFDLTKQFNTAMQPYGAYSIPVQTLKVPALYPEAVLSTYESYFTENPAITELTLNNSLIDLVTWINTYAGVSSLCHPMLIAPRDAGRPPTVRELMQRYIGEKKRVFAFLTSYPLEFKQIKNHQGITIQMRAEKQLKGEVAKVFQGLWKTTRFDAMLEELASMSLIVFGCNLLNIIPAAPQAVAVAQPVNIVSSVNWDGISIQHAGSVFRRKYAAFSAILQPDNLTSHCFSGGLITQNALETLQMPHSTRQSKSCQLLNIIVRTSKVDKTNLEKFLRIIEIHGSEAEKNLVRETYKELDPIAG